METIADYIQGIANKEGSFSTTNGTWLASYVGKYQVDTPDLWTYICKENKWEIIYGNAIQTVAVNLGATRPVNGSWIQAIYNKI